MSDNPEVGLGNDSPIESARNEVESLREQVEAVKALSEWEIDQGMVSDIKASYEALKESLSEEWKDALRLHLLSVVANRVRDHVKDNRLRFDGRRLQDWEYELDYWFWLQYDTDKVFWDHDILSNEKLWLLEQLWLSRKELFKYLSERNRAGALNYIYSQWKLAYEQWDHDKALKILLLHNAFPHRSMSREPRWIVTEILFSKWDIQALLEFAKKEYRPHERYELFVEKWKLLITSDPNNALKYFNEAKDIYSDDPKKQIDCLSLIWEAYANLWDYENAMNSLKEAIVLKEDWVENNLNVERKYAEYFILFIEDWWKAELDDFLYLIWLELRDEDLVIRICDLWLEVFPDSDKLKEAKAESLWEKLFTDFYIAWDVYFIERSQTQLMTRRLLNWEVTIEETIPRLDEIRELDPNNFTLLHVEKALRIYERLTQIQELWKWTIEQKKEAYELMKVLYSENVYEDEFTNLFYVLRDVIEYAEELWYYEEAIRYAEEWIERERSIDWLLSNIPYLLSLAIERIRWKMQEESK